MTGPFDELFQARLPEVARRAAAPVIRELVQALQAQADLSPEDALLDQVESRIEALDAARERARELRQTLRAAEGLGQRREALLDVLEDLSGGRGRRRDRRALRRNLDHEAAEDRIVRMLHRARQPLELLCVVLGGADLRQADAGRVSRVRQGLLRIAQERGLLWILREAAGRGAGACCTGDGDAPARTALRELARDGTQDPWVQAAALGTWMQITPPTASVFDLLEHVLTDDRPERSPDHAFFRARAIGLAARRQAWSIVRQRARAADSSEHVRMATVRALAASPSNQDTLLLVELVQGLEPSPRVRAAAVLAAIDVGIQPRIGIRLVRDALSTDEEVVGIVLSGLHYRQRPGRLGPGVARERLQAWAPSLERWRDDADVHPDVRTDAAAVLLSLELAADEVLARVWADIDRWAIEAAEGDTSVVHTDLEPERLLDVLALVAQHTQDLSATPVRPGTYRLFHGARPRPSLWRLAYETVHARPDKRQAFSHIVDRLPRGRLLAPSGCMAEVTETAVPGRPVCSATERWWHPDLPLPSWVLAASRRGSLDVRALPDIRMTLEPEGVVGRAAAPARYVHLARERTASAEAPTGDRVVRYDQALSKAGFTVQRHGLGGVLAAGGLGALDSLTGLFLGAGPTARELLSLDGNTLPQLAAFSVVIGVGWATTATLRQQSARAARHRLPLVIGGWGSRGKSGVERLKAAVFHELGYSVLSKTTGNEAMVVVGLPGREPVEVFLYRPYDRASIVEQREVLHLADRLDVQVLLWECMALNPRYVEILQQDWMRDDLTTLTNTYPDHEDIQGPSGVDVARSIATMLPRGARALTAEQSMTPILAEEARARGTQLDALSPEAWNLLPADVLARFPYDEHPRNIALVVALGRALGIRSDVALRAMADKVVPDLGVLKEYGPAQVEGRETSFVVGNSANERAGFLSNWQRMGFDRVPDGAGLTTCSALVVNNRRDRLARQAVFARVAALDAPVDRLVVIGTNVRPFVLAVHKALDGELRDRLRAHAADPQGLADLLCRRLRRPVLDADAAAVVLSAALPDWTLQALSTRVQTAYDQASPDQPPTGPQAGPVEQWIAELAWLRAVRTSDGPVPDSVIDATLDLLRRRILPIDDPDATGEAITLRVVRSMPAGCRVRMLGAANIKGTGLDLVYRWVQVDRVRSLLDEVLGRDVSRARVALRTLRALELGLLDRDEVLRRLGQGLDTLPDADLRVTAQELLDHLGTDAAARRAQGSAGPLRRTWRAVTSNLDLDAVVRRRAADRLYDDLAAGRVGLERAARVAKGLVERQKVE